MKRALPLAGIVALTWGLLVAVDGQEAGATVSPCTPGTWEVQDTSSPGTLLSAFALSPSDAWAVGYSPAQSALALHFDGISWNEVPVPIPDGASHTAFRAVSGTSPTDVWAVGYWDDQGTYRALIGHWDGTAWSIVPSPPMGTLWSLLYAVTAISPSDAWAVGYTAAFDNGGEADRALTMHWDGSSWSVVSSPTDDVDAYSYLHAISSSSSANVWGAGEHLVTQEPLIMRWDGASWTIMEEFRNAFLPHIAALSPSDVWAVGAGWETPGEQTPRIERWNGASWETLDIHAPDRLIGVGATSTQDVWIFGGEYGSGSFAEHWDGRELSLFPTQTSSATDFNPEATPFATLPSGDLWAVGTTRGRTGDEMTYVQHLCPIPVSDTSTASDSVARTATRRVVTSVRQGAGVFWKFLRSNKQQHEVRDASGMGLFGSGMRSRGGSYTRRFKSAGSYPWIDPVSGERGIVKVPIKLSTVSGSKTVVVWSRGTTPRGFLFDVQVKTPRSNGFAPWKAGVTSSGAVFHATRDGTYYVRARLRRVADGTHSRWSPRRSFEGT